MCHEDWGLGWSKDEMDATGADMKKRGALADQSQARVETASSNLSGSICPGSAQTPGKPA
jgi:hypothetical protein